MVVYRRPTISRRSEVGQHETLAEGIRHFAQTSYHMHEDESPNLFTAPKMGGVCRYGKRILPQAWSSLEHMTV